MLEVIVLFMWIGTVGLMLRNKAGCEDRGITRGLDYCIYQDSSKDKPHSDQPLARWDIGIAFDFVEM